MNCHVCVCTRVRLDTPSRRGHQSAVSVTLLEAVCVLLPRLRVPACLCGRRLCLCKVASSQCFPCRENGFCSPPWKEIKINQSHVLLFIISFIFLSISLKQFYFVLQLIIRLQTRQSHASICFLILCTNMDDTEMLNHRVLLFMKLQHFSFSFLLFRLQRSIETLKSLMVCK